MTEFSTALPLHKGGKARIIAVASAQRSKLAPDIATFIEGGVKDFTAQSYIGILAPAGTPPAIIAQLQKAIAAGLTGGPAPDKLRGMGAEIATPEQMTPAGFAAFIQRRLRAYARGRQARRDCAEMSGALPQGACDCHCHVFGPAARFPYAEPRSYTPDDAPLEAYLAMLDRLGFDRGVLVQPSAYGRDNRAMLDALTREPQRLRGVAVGGGELTAATLKAMACPRRARLARQRVPPRRQALLPERRRLEGNRAAAAGARRSRLAPATVGRCTRPAGDGGSAGARSCAGGGRSHGPPRAPSRHA